MLKTSHFVARMAGERKGLEKNNLLNWGAAGSWSRSCRFMSASHSSKKVKKGSPLNNQTKQNKQKLCGHAG